MDETFTSRRKKSDKAIEKYQKNGGFSSRHVRNVERILEKEKEKEKFKSEKEKEKETKIKKNK